jgi:hypothetical protein
MPLMGLFEPHWTTVLNRLIDLCFVIDMIMQFFVAYFDPRTGEWEYSPRRIATRYLTTWFIVDFLSVMPPPDPSLKSLRAVRLLRMVKLVKVVQSNDTLMRYRAQLGWSNSYVALFKLSAIVLLLAHWGACTWHLTARMYVDESGSNWLVAKDLVDAPAADRYLASFYWSIYTMVTIGYGDIGGTNTPERIVATVTMIIGGGVYSYVVGSVCGIVTTLDRAASDYTHAMDNLNRHMREERCSAAMRYKLRCYFVQCKKLHRDKYNNEVLKLMSPGLRREFSGHCHGAYIRKIRFFVTGTEEDAAFITAVALKMGTQACPAGEALIRRGERPVCMFMLRRGLVGCHSRCFSSGAYLGEDIILGKDLDDARAEARPRTASSSSASSEVEAKAEPFGDPASELVAQIEKQSLGQYTRDYRALCLTFVDVMTLKRDDLFEILTRGGQFTRHLRTVHKAAGWLKLKMLFRSISALANELTRRSGSLPQFVCLHDKILFFKGLLEHGHNVLPPEPLLSEEEEKLHAQQTVGEYAQELLSRYLDDDDARDGAGEARPGDDGETKEAKEGKGKEATDEEAKEAKDRGAGTRPLRRHNTVGSSVFERGPYVQHDPLEASIREGLERVNAGVLREAEERIRDHLAIARDQILEEALKGINIIGLATTILGCVSVGLGFYFADPPETVSETLHRPWANG